MFKGSEIQKFEGLEVQRFIGSKVERFRGSKVQSFIVWVFLSIFAQKLQILSIFWASFSPNNL